LSPVSTFPELGRICFLTALLICYELSASMKAFLGA